MRFITFITALVLFVYTAQAARTSFGISSFAKNTNSTFVRLSKTSDPNVFIAAIGVSYLPTAFNGIVKVDATTLDVISGSELTWNGAPLCCFNELSEWVEYPRGNPEFIYTVLFTADTNDTYYTLVKISVADYKVVATRDMVDPVSALAVDPAGNKIYAITSNGTSDNLVVILADLIDSTTTPLPHPYSEAVRFGGVLWPSIGASTTSIYLFASSYVVVMDKTTMAVTQNFSLPEDLFFDRITIIDEARDAIFATTHGSYTRYGFTGSMTKLALSPVALVATLSPPDFLPNVPSVAQSVPDFVIFDGDVSYWGFDAYYTYSSRVFAIDATTFTALGSSAVPSNMFNAAQVLAAGKLFFAADGLGTLDVARSLCADPVFTQTLTAMSETSYSWQVSISNPNTDAITDLRFSIPCFNAPESVSNVMADPLFTSPCEKFFLRLPTGVSIPAGGLYTFTYTNNANQASNLTVEYLACGVGSAPTVPPTPAPTTPPAPPAEKCSAVTLTQTLASEWTQSESVRNAVYNVILENHSQEKITTISITPGSGVQSTWGLEAHTDKLVFPAWASIPAGGQYSWGYIREGAGAATFTIDECDSVDTTAPPTDGGDETVSVTQEIQNQWNENGKTCQQVTVHIKNLVADKYLTSVTINPSTNFAEVQSFWSIQKNAYTLVFPSYVTAISPNDRHDFGYVNCGDLVTFTLSASLFMS